MNTLAALGRTAEDWRTSAARPLLCWLETWWPLGAH